MKRFLNLIFLLIAGGSGVFSQITLLPPQPFDSNILVQGSSAPSTVWFTPSYYTPISWLGTGGCPDGKVGYSGSWNNYWGNFIRLPEINCTGYDTVVLSFHVSHSWFSNHPNDWCRFYVWADNGYRQNVVSVFVDSIDVTHNAGANGKGFKFTQQRSCAFVEVIFDISTILNKSNILFYIEPSCQYNNSNGFFIFLDNIGLNSYIDPTVNIDLQNTSEDVHVFPSVSSDFVFLQKNSGNSEDVLIRIFDTGGTIVLSDNIKSFYKHHSIDISHLSSGVYFLVVSEKSKTDLRYKFMKQ